MKDEARTDRRAIERSDLETPRAERLAELERREREEFQRLREHERLEIKVRVVLQPGNSSELCDLELAGVTCDLSRGGCRAIFSAPVRVGDVYRLRFDRGALDLPLVFARCLRCRLLREDAFEVGFGFFTPIALADAAAPEERDLLA